MKFFNIAFISLLFFSLTACSNDTLDAESQADSTAATFYETATNSEISEPEEAVPFKFAVLEDLENSTEKSFIGSILSGEKPVNTNSYSMNDNGQSASNYVYFNGFYLVSTVDVSYENPASADSKLKIEDLNMKQYVLSDDLKTNYEMLNYELGSITADAAAKLQDNNSISPKQNNPAEHSFKQISFKSLEHSTQGALIKVLYDGEKINSIYMHGYGEMLQGVIEYHFFDDCILSSRTYINYSEPIGYSPELSLRDLETSQQIFSKDWEMGYDVTRGEMSALTGEEIVSEKNYIDKLLAEIAGHLG